MIREHRPSPVTRLPMPLDLSVTEAARLIGVTRARVYQRARLPGVDGGGRPLASDLRTDVPLRGVGVSRGEQIRIPLADALVWRSERAAQGLPVGPLPESVTPSDDPPAVGMPSIRPF